VNKDLHRLLWALCPSAYSPIALYYDFSQPRQVPLGTIIEGEPVVIPEDYFVALLEALEELLACDAHHDQGLRRPAADDASGTAAGDAMR
jgi:hypothetical protein